MQLSPRREELTGKVYKDLKDRLGKDGRRKKYDYRKHRIINQETGQQNFGQVTPAFWTAISPLAMQGKAPIAKRPSKE